MPERQPLSDGPFSDGLRAEIGIIGTSHERADGQQSNPAKKLLDPPISMPTLPRSCQTT